MTTTVTIDKAGRIVLPKPVRDKFRLSPGDSLELEISEGRIILRPARGKGRMYKKQGVWVLNSGVPLSAATVERTRHKIQRERERRFLGEDV